MGVRKAVVRKGPPGARYPTRSKGMGRTWGKSGHEDYRSLREKALDILRERGELQAVEFVGLVSAGANRRDAQKAIRFLEQDGFIWRRTPQQPWRLK